MLYRYETHCHSNLCSRCAHSSPAELVKAYHRKGYAEYVVSKIAPCDRFGGGRETVTFDRVQNQEGKL